MNKKDIAINVETAEILEDFIGDCWIESSGKSIYITGDVIEYKLLQPIFRIYFH